MTGSKGDKGEQGQKGDKGDRGDTGKQVCIYCSSDVTALKCVFFSNIIRVLKESLVHKVFKVKLVL